MDIKKLRKEIDRINKQIVDLLSERTEYVQQVAAYKQKHDLKYYDPSREKKIIEKAIGELDQELDYVTKSFKAI